MLMTLFFLSSARALCHLIPVKQQKKLSMRYVDECGYTPTGDAIGLSMKCKNIGCNCCGLNLFLDKIFQTS